MNAELTEITVVLRTLSDFKTLILFESIALEESSSSDLNKKIRLTRKQYYSRISSLLTCGLIMRQNGRYYLTSLGRVVSFYQTRLDKTLDNFWKLKAIDSILRVAASDLDFKESCKDFINLIEDEEIREMLMITHASKVPYENPAFE